MNMNANNRVSEHGEPNPAANADDPDHPFSRNDTFWELDRNLPLWARRSNPIVRRHLGGFLGAPIPQLGLLARLFIVQAVIIALSYFIPALLEIAALMGLASLFALPFSLTAYAWVLFTIGRSTSDAMISERKYGALDTLRTTPLSLSSILLSKIAVGLWRQAVNIDTILLAVSIFSLPPIIIEHASLYPPDEFGPATHLMIIVGLGASILRLLLEPLMIGAVGILVGAVSDLKLTALMWTTLLGIAYFALVNLPRLAIMPWPVRLVVESILPVVLPVVIMVGALAIARNVLERD